MGSSAGLPTRFAEAKWRRSEFSNKIFSEKARFSFSHDPLRQAGRILRKENSQASLRGS